MAAADDREVARRVRSAVTIARDELAENRRKPPVLDEDGHIEHLGACTCCAHTPDLARAVLEQTEEIERLKLTLQSQTHALYHVLVGEFERRLKLDPCPAIAVANEVLSVVEKAIPQFTGKLADLKDQEIERLKRERDEAVKRRDLWTRIYDREHRNRRRQVIDLRARISALEAALRSIANVMSGRAPADRGALLLHKDVNEILAALAAGKENSSGTRTTETTTRDNSAGNPQEASKEAAADAIAPLEAEEEGGIVLFCGLLAVCRHCYKPKTNCDCDGPFEPLRCLAAGKGE